MRLLVVLMLLSSCGTNIRILKPTDPVFIPYVEKFKQETGVDTAVTINFAKIPDHFAGQCVYRTDGFNYIEINKERWTYYNEVQKEQLIYHELGHCELGRKHNDNSIVMKGISCPESIMRSNTFNMDEINYCYNFDRQHYINELKN